MAGRRRNASPFTARAAGHRLDCGGWSGHGGGDVAAFAAGRAAAASTEMDLATASVGPAASGVRFAARTNRRYSLLTWYLFVAVVVTHPLHLVVHVPLVAALGREVQHVVRAHHHLHAAPVGRVGVKDIARVVFVEDADAWPFLRCEGPLAVVVVELALGHFLRREGDAEVAVEVGAMRGHPLELPAHAPAKGSRSSPAARARWP